MGTYTELRFVAKLKAPDNVVSFLNRVINERDLGTDKLILRKGDVFVPDFEHPFFECNRWYSLFLSTNFDEEMKGGEFYEKNDVWVLDLHTEFKNYDDEIDCFIDWITPFVIGRKKKQYVGWYKMEGFDRDNIYINKLIKHGRR